MTRLVRFVLAVWISLLTSRAYATTPPLTLTLISSSSDYSQGDHLEVFTQLTNVSAAPISVSTQVIGNLQVAIAKKDGFKIKPSRGEVLFESNPVTSASQDTQLLLPGESVLLPIIAADADGAWTVTTYKVSRRKSKALFYSFSAPGHITIRLNYKYVGNGNDLFSGTVSSNEVSFNVH